MIESAQGRNILALRPGLIGGSYPERSASGSKRMDGAFTPLHLRFAKLCRKSDSDLRAVADAIEAWGLSLQNLEDARLEEMLLALRRNFASQGLSVPLCQQAFALIREVASRRLGLRPYVEQLMGGWVILQGGLAEMATGEGKTLAASLPAAIAALAGIPVHVITANEYLVQRDAEYLAPL